ncbi:glycosyltransferase family 4 protein [Pontiella sp.]|uniref:glycosyltransferase family 4 protein n=1 Tax=Pontiella sp. TaxID=2837462 RepID=UPI00356B1735
MPHSEKPRIFHLDLAYTKGWSGGDNCTFETIKYFTDKPVENIHITTERCRAVYEEKGIREQDGLTFTTVPDFCEKPDGFELFKAYFRRIRAVRPILKNIDWKKDDVVILHNEFFVNTIPGLIPTKAGCRMFYWIHMISPDLFKGFSGQFTHTRHIPDPAFIHYWLSQRLCAFLMTPNGKSISHNPYYAELIPKLFPKCPYELIYPYSGVDPRFRSSAPAATFDYDCVWLGRFHAQKGLFDAIDTVAFMKKRKPDIRLALIGSGSEEMEKTVREKIEELELTENIILLGALFDREKYEALRRAKVYLMTSHFEGYCNVMVEALTMGLPVVAYDAPFHRVFTAGVIKVPMQDVHQLAESTLELLGNEKRRAELSAAAFEAGNRHTWEYVAEQTYKIARSTDG